MEDLVAQFCAISAADAEVARQYLEVADGDLESAITLFLESGGASIESQRHAADSRHSSTTTPGDEELSRRLQEEEYSINRQQEGPVRERIQPITERLVEPEFGGGVGSSGFGFGRGGSLGAVGWGTGTNDRNTPIGIFNQAPPRNIFEDADEIEEDDDDQDLLQQTVGITRLTRHQSRLANLFRPPFDLIRNLSLDQAKQEAHAAKKWILVNIQDSHEFACQQLNRDLWSNSQVKHCIKEYFIFLQYQHDSPAGAEYTQYYPFSTYPHIAILDPITGEQLKVWNLNLSASQWLEEAQDFLANYSLEPGHKNPISKIPKAKTDPEHMTEEEQIQYALRQSLGKGEDEDSDDDFVSVSSRQAIEDIDDEMEVTEIPGPSFMGGSRDEPVRIDEERHDNIGGGNDNDQSLTDEDRFAAILPEASEEPTDPRTTTRIQIRCGDGSRIIRRFNLTDPVRIIYSFIKSQVKSVRGHYFSLISERKNLLDLVDQTIDEAHLKNSVVLVEILD